MADPQSTTAVVMVPLPLQGHLNQLLHLSRLISDHHIPVHFISTTTHCHQAQLRVQGWQPLTVAAIHFHKLQPPNFTSPTPNPNPHSTTKFPSHLQPLCDSTALLRHPIATLLRKLATTTRRLVIIHDSLMGSVIQDFVTIPNAESYTFHSVSAFTILLYNLRMIRNQMMKGLMDHDDQESLTTDHLSFEDCFTAEFKKFAAEQHEFARLNSGRIYNSCRIIEQPTLELLENEERNRNKKLWALGPFNPVDIKRTTKGHKCVEWLDTQGPNSVIFISFGTTTSFKKEQIIEIAIGLEKSEQKFIWVLRDADKGDTITDNNKTLELPKGYEDRIKGRGLVVREWAPQLEILAHQATGGFMSHCGWNSCMESISMGVPIVAWPMHSDQPTNAVLVTNVLRVGITVKDWKWRNKIVVADDVERAVRALMATKEGAEMRRRATEMGGGVRKSVRENGVSWLQLKSFISHITR